MPQSLANILIHIIFSTKDRRPLILPEIENELHPYLAAVSNACRCRAHEVGGAADHIHMICSLDRSTPVRDLLEDVKKRSSKWIKTKGPAYSTFAWQRGYAAFSVGQSQLEAVRRYIREQKKHHTRRDFKAELLAFLTKYRVAYDERYLWD